MAQPRGDRSLFELDDVSLVGDDGVPILSHVSLALPADGITVLAGPSGAGKSTLLRLCNRLEVPSAGTVCFRGTDVAGLDPLAHRRSVGMVFQRPAVFGGTVRDNLRVADPGGDDDRFAMALERVGLGGDVLDQQADQLSGGEAQRMCLARTLLTDPQVLLMDEATSALDPDIRLLVERLVRRFADAGLPVVWVTHDLEQLRRIADHIVVLVEGRNATTEEAEQFLGEGVI